MVWVGIVANLALAIPTLFVPERLMAMSGFPPASAALAAVLGVAADPVEPFYMPAGLDLDRYRWLPGWPCSSRLAGVVFFRAVSAARIPRCWGYFDLVFFVPEAALLTDRVRPAAAARPAPGDPVCRSLTSRVSAS